MKPIWSAALILALILLSTPNTHAQFYANTSEVIQHTNRIRKKQEAHHIQNAFLQDGNLIINFTATLSKRSGPEPYHILLPVDSVVALYRNEPLFYQKLDSLRRNRFHVLSVGRRYSNITNRRSAAGIDIMCLKEILVPGYYDARIPQADSDSVEIMNSDKELFALDEPSRIFLKGKHIVLLYYLPQPRIVDGVSIDYLVLNIENSSRVKDLNYLKLPFAIICDTILLPFTIMLSGMKE